MPKVPQYPRPQRTIPKLEPGKTQATRTTPTHEEPTSSQHGLVTIRPAA